MRKPAVKLMILFQAVVLSVLGVLNLAAQGVPAASVEKGPPPSRADIFLGYSYFGTMSRLSPDGRQFDSINSGGMASGAYFFTRHLGAEFNFAAHEGGYNTALDPNDSLFAISAGPVVRTSYRRVSLFAHGLAGAGNLLGPNSNHPATFFHNPYVFGPTFSAGGGLDLRLPYVHNLLSYRFAEVDYRYVHANFGPYNAANIFGVGGGSVNMNGFELSSGLVFNFSSFQTPVPIAYACVAAPSSVYGGEAVTITGTGKNLDRKKSAAYTWPGNAIPVSAKEDGVAEVGTTGLTPGIYTVRGHVAEGNKPKSYQVADCTSTFTVKPFDPPTISCSADPAMVSSGESSTVTAIADSPQHRPLTYRYSATGGVVSGSGTVANLATSGMPGGTIDVTCAVTDDQGMTASARTSVTVATPPPPPAPGTSSLCALHFDRDPRRPARVDNEMKACLDSIALSMERSTDAKLALTGNDRGAENRNKRLAAQRAINAEDYLVHDKGIDSARLIAYTGVADSDTVTTTSIPAGASFAATDLTRVDESVVRVQTTAENGHPARHERHHHREHHKKHHHKAHSYKGHHHKVYRHK